MEIQECGGVRGVGVGRQGDAGEQGAPLLEGEVGVEVGGAELGGDGHGGAGAAEGDVERGEVGGDGAGPGGGDDGGFGLLEEPLDSFAIRLVTKFARELEDAGGAEGGHSDAAATTVHLGVPVLRGRAFGRRLFAVCGLRRHRELVGSCGIGRAGFCGDC